VRCGCLAGNCTLAFLAVERDSGDWSEEVVGARQSTIVMELRANGRCLSQLNAKNVPRKRKHTGGS